MNKPANIAPDKRMLIAEVLLAGENLERIYERLIASGASPASADYELRRAEKDPFFQTAAALQRRIAKRDRLPPTAIGVLVMIAFLVLWVVTEDRKLRIQAARLLTTGAAGQVELTAEVPQPGTGGPVT